MNENPENRNRLRTRQRVAGGIGGVLGATTGLVAGKLIGYESLWLGMVLVGGCTGLAIFVAQKIASK